MNIIGISGASLALASSAGCLFTLASKSTPVSSQAFNAARSRPTTAVGGWRDHCRRPRRAREPLCESDNSLSRQFDRPPSAAIGSSMRPPRSPVPCTLDFAYRVSGRELALGLRVVWRLLLIAGTAWVPDAVHPADPRTAVAGGPHCFPPAGRRSEKVTSTSSSIGGYRVGTGIVR